MLVNSKIRFPLYLIILKRRKIKKLTIMEIFHKEIMVGHPVLYVYINTNK